MQKLAINWKTSAQGLLSLAICLVIAYTSLPAGAKWSVITVALCKAALGFLQKDAGVVTALVAGTPAVVESHEVPNDPQAVVKL